MSSAGVDGIFIAAGVNLEYFTGEPRRPPTPVPLSWQDEHVLGAWVAIDAGPVLAIPRMAADYEVENAEGLPVRILEDTDDPVRFLGAILDELSIGEGSVAIDDNASARFVLDLIEAKPDLSLVPGGPLVSAIRRVKDDDEIEMLREAAHITDRAFGAVVAQMKVGISERELTAEVDFQLRQFGSRPAYPIAALGWGIGYPRAKLERNHPLDVPMTELTIVLFDFGALWQGYCADFSRVVHFADPGPAYRAAYADVVDTQIVTIDALGKGLLAEDVYRTGMKRMEQAGLDRYFPDPLGHGIGMDIHESPSLSVGDRTVIEAGMVLAVEPQVFNGPMHIRLEDLVVVRQGEVEKLNEYPSDLVVLG